MNLYYNLLKSFLNKEIYDKYYNKISVDFLSKNYPDLYKVYLTVPLVHKGLVEYSVDDLEVAFFAAYPQADPNLTAILFKGLGEAKANPEVVKDALEQLFQREQALRIAKIAISASEGQGSLDEVQAVLEETPPEEEKEELFVTASLLEIFNGYFKAPGLRWRLKSLNGALGSLRKGNFGFIFARPESGKTTFLASEITHMAGGLPEGSGPIIWFNNEQDGKEVKGRIQQAAFGLTEQEIRDTIEACNKEYAEFYDPRILLVDDAGLTRNKIEQICRQYKPSLIIFDQIDKIGGFKADRNDLELKEIYVWARGLAKTYCPVIGVCQAGATGENKKWLTMNDVDNSKTGKQGEADWILGIGTSPEMGQEQLRFLCLSKNKLHGDEDTDPSRRHDRWAVLIKPERARYVDLYEG